MRGALLDASFAVADRLARLGLVPVTARARRLVARVTGDRYSVGVDGVTIAGSLADHGTYLHILARGGGHPFHRRLFVEAIEPGMVVVDCGAHIGLYTVLAARRVGPGGNVIAVEPAPPNLEALRANVEANGLADRVELVEAAASDREGVASLYLHTELDQTGLSRVPERFRGEVEVRSLPLDQILGERRVDVVKIDVEGAEELALRGLRQTLERTPGAIVFIECHPLRLIASGTNPVEWLADLRASGALELIDEGQRELLPASDERISSLVHAQPEAINLRWQIDGTPPQ